MIRLSRIKKRPHTGQAIKQEQICNIEEILAYVGSYMTYDEFVKNCPEVELSKHDWYKLNQDKTYQQTKSELKRTYLGQFQNDWDSKREIAFNLIRNAKK